MHVIFLIKSVSIFAPILKLNLPIKTSGCLLSAFIRFIFGLYIEYISLVKEFYTGGFLLRVRFCSGWFFMKGEV